MEQGKNLITKRSITVGLVVLFLCSIILPTSVLAQEEQVTTAGTVGVQYQTHIQDIGWETDAGRGWKNDGALSGTVGESKRLEALIIKLTGNVPSGANIQTKVHVQDNGDMGPFDMGYKAGTEGYGLRMERITLTLRNLPGYTLKYNVQVENLGWLRDENDDTTWFSSGEPAGTTGKSLRLESIKVKLVEVNEEYEAYLAALAAVKEDDYSISSWATYQEVVAANVVTESTAKATIVKATANINAAQKILVKTKNLKGYNAALAAAVEENYTPDTWTVYKTIVDANVVTLAGNTQTEIDLATARILLAQKDLQKKINITDYYDTLAAVREADYTPESWAIYQKIVAANVVTEADSQVAVDEATRKIKAAQVDMVKVFDFRAYNALLAAVKEENYTSVSWGLYDIVVKANVKTQNDTQTDIETAIKAIQEAQKKLVKAGDLTTYNLVLEAAKKANYTTVSWTVYQKVLDANIVTKNFDQASIDKATANILAAQLKLMPTGNMADYNAELALVKDKKAEYTSASWAAYQKVVETNVVTAASGQSVIDAATAKIEAARLKVLIKAGDTKAYQTALANYVDKEDLYTSVSWAAYQKIVMANMVTPDNLQTVIDAATKKITDAQTQVLVLKAPLTEYQKYVAVVNAVKEEDYTMASWTLYKKVLATNYMTEDKSKLEIQTAVKNLQTAQLTILVKKGVLTEYDAAIDKYDGRSEEFKTIPWATYQKVVDTNVVSTETAQAVINAAKDKIIAAQKKLDIDSNKAAKMTYYNEALTKTDGKQAIYTKDSWSAYQAILVKNLVTKDNTQDQVNQATINIDNAQKNLILATDITPFLESLKIYQENILNKGLTQALASNWSLYENAVKSYADFNYTTGEWVPTAITSASSQSAVNAAADAINAALNSLVSNSNAASLAAYKTAKTLPDPTKVADDYTKDSYALYMNECNSSLNIFLYLFKATSSELNAATARINVPRATLELKATDLVAFNAEVAAYKELAAVQEDTTNGKIYDAAGWLTYNTDWINYYDQPITCLKPDYNNQSEYDAATAKLKADRLALTPTPALTVSEAITKTALQAPGIHVGTDLLTSAKALVTAAGYTTGYTVTLANPAATPNVGVDADGKVLTGATTVTISFTVSQDANSTTNTHTVTIAGLSVTP